MTRPEVAEYLKIALPSVDRLAKAGVLREYRLSPRVVRYRRDDVEALLQPAV